MIKVVDFPTRNEEAKRDIQEFLDEVKTSAEENSATQAIVVMMDDNGQVGLSASGAYVDIMGMLCIAMKEL